MIQVVDITNSIFNSKTYILQKEGADFSWLIDIGDVKPVIAFLEKRVGNSWGVFDTRSF